MTNTNLTKSNKLRVTTKLTYKTKTKSKVIAFRINICQFNCKKIPYRSHHRKTVLERVTQNQMTANKSKHWNSTLVIKTVTH